MMKFNLNGKIYFKLTSQGQKRFADPYFTACVKYDQGRQLYACQMHAFCNLFGPTLVVGGQNDVEMAVYFDINELESVAEMRTSCIACHGTGIQQETSVGGHPQRCGICEGTGIKPVSRDHELSRNTAHQAPRVYPFGKI